jgi:cytoskeleton protein RodZ
MIERHTISPNVGPAPEPARPSAGALLQLAREDAGLTLDAVAQQLKLAPRQVRAIEEDDFAGLPGRTFVRGFVRNYARLLHLDAEAVLASLPGASTPSLDSPALHQTAPTIGELPTAERGKSSWTRWAIPLTLVAIIAAAAAYEFSRGRDLGRRTPAVGTEAISPGSAEVAPTPGQPAAGVAAPTANQGASQALPNPLTGKEPAADTTQGAAGGSATTSTATDVVPYATLVLTFRDSAWTEVKDRNGRVLVSQMMAGGRAQPYTGMPPFELVIGNASEVSLTYRGEPVDLAPHTRSGVARLTLR